MDSDPLNDPQAIRQRARLLMDQGRHADAAEWFQRLLGLTPNDAHALSQLAVCWCQVPGKGDDAVQAARQALSLEPDESHFHSVLALTLLEGAKSGQDSQVKEAAASAAKALELDPDSSLAHGLNGLALLRLRKYAEAEKAARMALQLDTTSTLATQVLSMALLNQKKDSDLDSLVDWQLQENPEESAAHISAGYRALMNGKHKDACAHFKEALRLDPTNEGARLGLIDSFRARSLFYRLYLKFSYFMAQFGRQGAGAIMLGGFLLYRVAFNTLRTNHPGIAYTLAGLWMLLALWSFLARGLGSALMLTDRFVRMAITPKERFEGLCVGLAVLLALGFLSAGLWLHRGDLILAALAFALSSVPVASAFSNDHHSGVWLYTALAVVSGGAALVFGAGTALEFAPLASGTLFQAAVYTGVGCTWLRFLGVMYR